MILTDFAVIITHNRPELLAQCVAAIGPQVQMVIVLDNASDPPATLEALQLPELAEWLTLLVPVAEQPPVIPHLWQTGLDIARDRYLNSAWQFDLPMANDWKVAMLCDDAIAPAGWFAAVTAAMRETGAVAGAADPFGRGTNILQTAHNGSIADRMPGWAFVVDGYAGPIPDDSMHWWWCDTDMDWQARTMGGMILVGTPGLAVHNVHPGEFTNTVPGLGEQTGRDRQAFAAKWGSAPW